MGHKEFTKKHVEIDGPTFAVEGTKFRCMARPPHGFIADLLEARAGNFYSATAMRAFIRGSLIEEDEKAWDELQYAKSKNSEAIIDVDLLGDIFGYLVEEFFGRPTQPPSGSPDGRKPIEAISTDASPSPDEASNRSMTSDTSTSPMPSEPKASPQSSSRKSTSRSKSGASD